MTSDKMDNNEFRKKCQNLRNQFPHLFWTCRPWAIGSGKSIRQLAKNIPVNIINICISMHTSSKGYLEASVRGDNRITPDGRDAGPMTEIEKNNALLRLTNLESKGSLKDTLTPPRGYVMPKEGFRNLTLQNQQKFNNIKTNKSNSKYNEVCASHASLPSYEMAVKKSKQIQFRSGNDKSFGIWKCRVCGGYHFGNRDTKSYPKSNITKRHHIENERLSDIDMYNIYGEDE